MDVKTTFLNGVIEEEVYIKQPEGFETHEKRTHVCRLKKALYGLKQAPKAWYGRIDSYIQQLGFIKSNVDPNLYYLLAGRRGAFDSGSSVDKKSTTGYCFGIGSGMTSWYNKKQKSVALSSAKAEYMAASKATCEAIWLRTLLVNLFKRRMEATRIFCDNQSCIKLSENPIFHDRSKHIDILCHFIEDCV
eukprot:PITA_28483